MNLILVVLKLPAASVGFDACWFNLVGGGWLKAFLG